MTTPSYIADARALHEPKRKGAQAYDILWGRPIFRAPPLPNPRVIFDPLPFRALLPYERRPVEHFASRHLNAA